MPIYSKLIAIYIISQSKVFWRQRIPEFGCAKRKTVNINIVGTVTIKIMKKKRLRPAVSTMCRKNLHRENEIIGIFSDRISDDFC